MISKEERQQQTDSLNEHTATVVVVAADNDNGDINTSMPPFISSM